MTPERSGWSLEAQRENPPRLIRLRRIDSLLTAFAAGGEGPGEVGARLEAFLTGCFVAARQIEHYSVLVSEIEATLAKRLRQVVERQIGLDDLVSQFADLLRLRRKLEEAKHYNAGLLEVGYPRYYALWVGGAAIRQLAAPIAELDRILGLFIAPAGQSFTEEELVARFGFPSENLGEIDLEWF